MKKTYQIPEVEIIKVTIERCILSTVNSNSSSANMTVESVGDSSFWN